MKLPPILQNLALGVLFDALRLAGLKLKKFIQDERFKFVLGLTSERFSHAEFYINGRKDVRLAKTFQDMEMLAKHFCQEHHMKFVDKFTLLRMWASRSAIRFQSNDTKIEILTYWYF